MTITKAVKKAAPVKAEKKSKAKAWPVLTSKSEKSK